MQPTRIPLTPFWDLSFVVGGTREGDNPTPPPTPPSAFGLPAPNVKPLCRVRGGASVNCDQWNALVPHGCGTHTECYGHVSPNARPYISEVVPSVPVWMPVLVVDCGNGGIGGIGGNGGNGGNGVRRLRVEEAEWVQSLGGKCSLEEDWVLGKEVMDTVTPSGIKDTVQAVYLRTLPTSYQFTGTNPTYVSVELMQHLVQEWPQVRHLLVDLPSVDREDDGGLLLAHRTFFQARVPSSAPVEEESLEGEERKRTITELVQSPSVEQLPAGVYWLNLQLLRVQSDATPSRPILVPYP